MYSIGIAGSIITPVSTALACGGMILVCVLATVLACTDILKHPASTLMKGGNPEKRRGRKKVSGKRRGRSLYSRLILRNMIDDKARVTISFVIIGFSCMLIGTGITAKLAFDGMVEKELEDVHKYDLRMDLSDTANSSTSIMDELKGDEEKKEAEEETRRQTISEIEKVMESRGAEYLPVTYESNMYYWDDRLDGATIICGDPDRLDDYFGIRDVKTGEKLTLPDEGILVQNKMAESYGMTEGKVLPIMDNALQLHDAEIKGMFHNYLGRVILVSPEAYMGIFGKENTITSYFIRMDGGDEEALTELREALLDADADLRFDTPDTIAEQFKEAAKLYNLVVIITTLIAILMTFMILTNLANIFMSRKKNELTVMRVNGFSIRQTKGYLSRETIVTAAAGIILGVLTGGLMDPWIISQLEQPDQNFVRTFQPAAWIAAAAMEIIFAVIIYSSVFRKVKNLNLRDIA